MREVRRQRHISQEKLAEMVDGHRNFIGKIERGEVNFTFDYAMNIARALKVKPSILLELIPQLSGKSSHPPASQKKAASK